MAPHTLPALALPELPEEVQAFAREKGVSQYLPGVQQWARQLFPRRKTIVQLENDPELCYNTQIVFDVDVAELTRAEISDLRRRWEPGLLERCPATDVHFFCLGLRIMP